MWCRRQTFFLLCLAFIPLGQTRGEELPPNFDVELFDADEIEASAREGRACELYFFDEVHTVRLEPIDLRSYRFRAVSTRRGGSQTVYRGPARTMQGRVLGDPESIVRLTVVRGGVRGYLKTSDGWTFIRPLPPASAVAEGEHMVFTDGDLDTASLGVCATTAEHSDTKHSDEATLDFGTDRDTGVDSDRDPVTGEANGELNVVELAVDADFEYFSIYGQNATQEIESILNEVDGIFRSELDLTIEIVQINVWEDSADPYSATDSNALLIELRNHWNANNANIDRDLVHLFTGRDLDGFTVGIAYVGVVCNNNAGYGLSQDLTSRALMPTLLGHELGHNLDAGHDTSGSSPRYIMYPSVSSSNLDEFSGSSKSDIASYVGRVGCLELVSDNGDPDTPKKKKSGGGGGPVDPLLLVLLAGAYTCRRYSKAMPATPNDESSVVLRVESDDADNF